MEVIRRQYRYIGDDPELSGYVLDDVTLHRQPKPFKVVGTARPFSNWTWDEFRDWIEGTSPLGKLVCYNSVVGFLNEWKRF